MHHLYLVFVESQVQIMVQSLDVLIEVFMFSQVVPGKGQDTPSVRLQPPSATFFTTRYSLVIL